MDRLAPRRRPRRIGLLTALATAAVLAMAGIAAAAALPPDFPGDVPLPPGQVQSATGGGGQWSVLLLVDGSAADAHAAAFAFYRAHGFVADTDSILHDASHQVTIVVENRDHSAARTFVAIGVGARQAAPSSGRVALASRLAGRGSGFASVTISGARLCWTVRNLRGVAHPTAATLRHGASGHTGPVIVRLGRGYRASGCTTIAAALGRSIAARPSGFYVAVATRAHPGAAVRGQLRAA
jgi:CHRD domain